MAAQREDGSMAVNFSAQIKSSCTMVRDNCSLQFWTERGLCAQHKVRKKGHVGRRGEAGWVGHAVVDVRPQRDQIRALTHLGPRSQVDNFPRHPKGFWVRQQMRKKGAGREEVSAGRRRLLAG